MRSRYTGARNMLYSLHNAGLLYGLSLFGILLLLSSCSGSRESVPVMPDSSPAPIRGFQIQVHTTPENASAHAVAAQVTDWFDALNEDMKRTLYGSTELPVEIKWLQPYYRVRIGHFRTRAEARAMMEKVAEDFPAAFVVPNTIQ